MNAEQHTEIVRRLTWALTQAGVALEQAVRRGGSIIGWQAVPMDGIVGRWLQNGWRVSLVDPPGTVAVAEQDPAPSPTIETPLAASRTLRLMEDEDDGG